MAIPIRTIPILSGQIAKYFENKINSSANQKGSVDFSKQLESAKNILNKSRFRQFIP